MRTGSVAGHSIKRQNAKNKQICFAFTPQGTRWTRFPSFFSNRVKVSGKVYLCATEKWLLWCQILGVVVCVCVCVCVCLKPSWFAKEGWRVLSALEQTKSVQAWWIMKNSRMVGGEFFFGVQWTPCDHPATPKIQPHSETQTTVCFWSQMMAFNLRGSDWVQCSFSRDMLLSSVKNNSRMWNNCKLVTGEPLYGELNSPRTTPRGFGSQSRLFGQLQLIETVLT